MGPFGRFHTAVGREGLALNLHSMIAKLPNPDSSMRLPYGEVWLVTSENGVLWRYVLHHCN